MLAKEHRVPVVACVETYKFGERVVLDGVASNELADPASLLEIPVNQAVQIKKPYPPSLTPLSLMYDLTPPSLITAVCTEVGQTMDAESQLMLDRFHPAQLCPYCPRQGEWCRLISGYTIGPLIHRGMHIQYHIKA